MTIPYPDLAVVKIGSTGRVILASMSRKATVWMKKYFPADKVTAKLTVEIVVPETVDDVCQMAEGDGLILEHVQSGSPD